MTPILSNDDKELLDACLAKVERVVVMAHTNPDGDAIGSVTAAVAWMQRIGKQAAGVVPNMWPDFLGWIPGAEDLVAASREPGRVRQLLHDADLLLVMDMNQLSRLEGELATWVSNAKAKRVMIDHHLNPDRESFDITISHPEMCSACEVLLRTEMALGMADDMTLHEATSLYTGMMTDTNAFTVNSGRGDVFRAVAWLLDRGVNKDKAYRNIFWSSSEERLRMTGYMLSQKMQMVPQCRGAILTMTNEERERMHIKNGDTEGLVNMPLQIAGTQVCIFLREDTEIEGRIRISSRSVDDFPCNVMCGRFFNGGGHKNASGGHLDGLTMDEAVALAVRAMEATAAELTV